MIKTLTSLFLLCPFASYAVDPQPKETFQLNFGSFNKSYPVKKMTPNAPVKIAYVYDFADNMDMAEAATNELVEKIKKAGLDGEIQVIVTPGDKGNTLAGYLYSKLKPTNPDLKLAIFRKSAKGGSFSKITYQSITSNEPQEMHIRTDQADTLQGKTVLMFDDVISTGASMKAAGQLVARAGGKVLAYACVATEGITDPTTGQRRAEFEGKPLFKLSHLPVTPVSSR